MLTRERLQEHQHCACIEGGPHYTGKCCYCDMKWNTCAQTGISLKTDAELLNEKIERLEAARDDLKHWQHSCWACAEPEMGDPERHEHEPQGGHWHHYIDPGDGLPSPCKNSAQLERIFQDQTKRAAELEATVDRLTRELAEVRKNWETELNNGIAHWMEENARLREALTAYAKHSNWTEYSLSLKRHWYWTDGTCGWPIAEAALRGDKL